jgi:hypothetical protein
VGDSAAARSSRVVEPADAASASFRFNVTIDGK